MGQLFSRDEKDREIISKRSLRAVLDIISFLKEGDNIRTEGIFRWGGRADTRRKILASLLKGDRMRVRRLDGSVIECAAALQLFLLHLRQPLIPTRVQQLVLAENPGVPEKIVACDALGLLRQDLSGRHLELLTSLLDLLNDVTRNSPTSSELHGCNLPIVLLPTFFNLKEQSDALIRWKQVAATFHELISVSPLWLRSAENVVNSDSDTSTASDTVNSGSVSQDDSSGGIVRPHEEYHAEDHQLPGGEPSPDDGLVVPARRQLHSRLHPLMLGRYV